MNIYLAVYGNADGGNFGRTFLATDFENAILKARKIMTDSGYTVFKSLAETGSVEIITL